MKSNHRLFFKKFILDFWVGFIAYVVILAFIFYSFQDHIWSVFFLALAWTFFWLTYYAEHVALASARLYEDFKATRYCKNTFEKGINDIDSPSVHAR